MDISKPGTVIVIYSDDGPSEPSENTTSIDCPHTEIHVFENRELMHEFVKDGDWNGQGRRPRVQSLTVGEGHSLGTFLTIHKQER